MKNIKINDTMNVSLPDSFEEMSREERAAYKDHSGDHGICFKSSELHIILSIAWTRVDGIRGVFSRMLRGKDLVKNMENWFKKQMKSFDYQMETRLNRQIGGLEAEGLRYSYTAQGIDMTGETYSLEKDQTLYYFHCYYRSEFIEESQAACGTIFDSVRW